MRLKFLRVCHIPHDETFHFFVDFSSLFSAPSHIFPSQVAVSRPKIVFLSFHISTFSALRHHETQFSGFSQHFTSMINSRSSASFINLNSIFPAFPQFAIAHEIKNSSNIFARLHHSLTLQHHQRAFEFDVNMKKVSQQLNFNVDDDDETFF